MLAAAMARLQSPEALQAAKGAAGGIGGGSQTSGGVVAVVRARGIVVKTASVWDEMFGFMSTDSLRKTMASLYADQSISTIIIDWDSPGGVVPDGVYELTTYLRSMRGVKRTVSVANTLLASAAYWVGSAATEIVATPSATVGSIGVFGAHVDLSGMYAAAGVKVTLITAGDYKAEGEESQPLSPEALAEMQRGVDEIYDHFIDDVAKNRGIKTSDVLANYGQGRAFSAERAMKIGMIDRIDTLESVISGEVAAIQNKRKNGFSAETARRKLALLAAAQKKILH